MGGRSKLEFNLALEAQLEGWNTLTCGWPDLTMWKESKDGKIALAFAEQKSSGQRLSFQQHAMLSLLKRAGFEVFVSVDGLYKHLIPFEEEIYCYAYSSKVR